MCLDLLFRSRWCSIFTLLLIMQVSKQDSPQPDNKQIMTAILNLETHLEEKLSELLNDKLSVLLEDRLSVLVDDKHSDLHYKLGNAFDRLNDDLALIKGLSHSIEGEVEAFGERSSISLTNSENMKLLQEQLFKELKDLKQSINLQFQDLGKKVESIEDSIIETNNETSIMIQNMTDVLEIKIESLEEVFYEVINETSSLIQNMTEDLGLHVETLEETFIVSRNQTYASIQNVMGDTAALKEYHETSDTSIKELLRHIKRDIESLKLPMEQLLSLNNPVKEIQMTVGRFQETLDSTLKGIVRTHETTVEELFQNTRQEIESLKSPVNQLSELSKSIKKTLATHDTSAKELLQSIKQETNSIKAPVNLINSLDGYVQKIWKTVDRCPESFFMSPGSNQCFKVYIEKARTWMEADAKCMSLGLRLAKPYNSVSIRKYLNERYDSLSHVWVGARGDGTYMRWTIKGNPWLHDNSPLWLPGHPGTRVTNAYCLRMMTHNNYVRDYPEQPYSIESCSSRGYHYTLCEHVYFDFL